MTSEIEIVDTAREKVGADHPVVAGWYETLFNVASMIKPFQTEAYEAAMRLTKLIEDGASPDQMSMDDIEKVFRAADREFQRILIVPSHDL